MTHILMLDTNLSMKTFNLWWHLSELIFSEVIKL